MIRACNVDIEEKTDEMTVIEVTNTIVDPGAMVIFKSWLNRCNGSSRNFRTHAKYTSIKDGENAKLVGWLLTTHLLHDLQWCVLGGLYLSQTLQYLGVPVSFLTSTPSACVSGFYRQIWATFFYSIEHIPNCLAHVLDPLKRIASSSKITFQPRGWSHIVNAEALVKSW